jgi:enoyl-CoA hydratase
MTFDNLLTELKGRIQYITINRESKLNALNAATLADLHTAFSNAIANPEVGGIIITGAGPKAFIAGADISEFVTLDAGSGRELAQGWQNKVFNLVANCGKPVIAAVNGFALGGGLEMAMACHIRVASDNAKLGLPELTLGIIPGYGGTQRLTQLVGRGKALEMIMTSDMVTAQQAYMFGLVNYVVSAEELMPKTEQLMNKILARAPLAIASAITAVNASLNSSVNGFETEINEFAKCTGSEDFKEGVAAFLQKRSPVFKGK